MRRVLLLFLILIFAALALPPDRPAYAKKKNRNIPARKIPSPTPTPTASPSINPAASSAPTSTPNATRPIWARATEILQRSISLIGLTCLLAWIILLLPSGIYLFTTWRNRRQSLFDRLTPKPLTLYYSQFFPSTAPRRIFRRRSQQTDIKAQFRSDFGRLYGRRHYILPLLLLALISAIGLRATSQSVEIWSGFVSGGKAYPPIAISAFLGGYAWALYDQFIRFRTGDFTAHDVYGGVYRFLIAIPLGISLATFFKDSTGIAIAFLLAAFPTTTLFTIVRRLLANQKLGLSEGQEAGSLELEKLQSIGKSNAERYADEGITTIAELAWADPIDLTIKTNREFNFVVDSISQALLWVYFEDSVRKLYPLSLRGAQEVCSLLQDLDSDDPKAKEDKEAAEKILQAGAKIMKLDRDSFLYTLGGVAGDPYAQFLFDVWGLTEDSGGC